MYAHHFREKPKLDLVKQYLSPDHMNASDRNNLAKHNLIREMQAFEHDTGTMPVQIALLSHRIAYLTAHCQEHKKDHHTRRGLLILLSRRRKQLKYLRRQDFERYVQVIRRFHLKDNYYLSGWGERYRVGTNLKWTPEESEKEFLGPAKEQQKLLRERRAVKQPVHVKSGVTVTQKEGKKLELCEEIARNRRQKLQAAWRRRLKSRTDYLPLELQLKENWDKLQAMRAQMGAMSDSEWEAWRAARRAEWVEQRRARKSERREFVQDVLGKFQ